MNLAKSAHVMMLLDVSSYSTSPAEINLLILAVFFLRPYPPAELWHFSGVLQPHCASLFHQREKKQRGASGGGLGSHGQLGESL